MLKSPLTYEPHGVASWRAVAAAATIPRRFLEARRFDLVLDVHLARPSEGHPVDLLADTPLGKANVKCATSNFIYHSKVSGFGS